MQESKILATHRLQREHRWDIASAFKDLKIKELRAGGMPRKEAGEVAWRLMIEEYPPLAVEPDADPQGDLVGVDDLPDSAPDKFLESVFWVFNQLGRANVSADTAPSSGCLALLRWARRNEDRFFEQILPKAFAVTKKVEQVSDDVAMAKASMEHAESLEQMLGLPSVSYADLYRAGVPLQLIESH